MANDTCKAFGDHMKELNISENLDFNLDELIGKCIGILGIRGSGKSNTAGVIFEELLKLNYPLTVVDIDGEYFGLKEQYELLVIGQGENVDISIEPEDAAQVAEISIKQSIPVVLDLSGFLKDEQRSMLKGYFTDLWNWAGKLRKPYMIGIEESHEFIPQGRNSELKEIITRLALRGRKRGLGAVIISQRSAKVEKDVLTQAGMLFLHRVVHEADMKVYNDLLPWSKSEVRKKVNQLDTGDCIFLDEKSTKKIYVRERSTFHAGFTPSLDTVETPQLKQVGESIIEAIQDAKETGKRKKSQIEQLEEKVDELEEKLAKKNEQVKELKRTAETLGYIEVDFDNQQFPKVQKISKAVIESLDIAEVIKNGEKDKAFKAIADALVQQQEGQKKRIDKVNRSIAKNVLNNKGSKQMDEGDFSSARSTSFGIPYEEKKSKLPEKKQSENDNFQELPNPIKTKVDHIAHKVNRLEPMEQEVLAFLVKHRPYSYSVQQISAWLKIPTGQLLSNRPTHLLDIGIIIRENRSIGLHYRANLKNFVTREFEIYEPDFGQREKHLVIKELKRQFLRVIQPETPKNRDSIKLASKGSSDFGSRLTSNNFSL